MYYADIEVFTSGCNARKFTLNCVIHADILKYLVFVHKTSTKQIIWLRTLRVLCVVSVSVSDAGISVQTLAAATVNHPATDC